MLGVSLPAAVHAAGSLDQWRSEAGVVRTLTENDAPRAYQQAQRLQTTLPADATASDRARALNLLARTEIYLALTEQAANHARLALELATSQGDRVGQAEADLNVALNSVNQGDIDALIAVTTHGLSVLEGVNRPDLLGEALLRTAMMYRRLGQIDESVEMCVQAMAIARRTNDRLALTYAHQGLAISYDQSDRFEEARELYLQMRRHAQAAHSKLLEAYALSGMGSLATKLGDFRGGKTLLKEAIQLFREVGTPFDVNFGLFGLAAQLRSQGRPAEALPILGEVLATYERYPNRIGLWYTLNARSSDYQALGNIVAALADAERAYALARDIGFPLYIAESMQRVAAVSAAAGDHRRAYELSIEAAGINAKSAREKLSSRMVELAQRYESESKQREIDELTHRNEQQTAELRQRTLQQRWLWTVLASSVAALMGTAVFLFHLRRSQREMAAVNAQLQRSQNEIRGLNASLEQRVQAGTAELRQQTRYLRTLFDTLPLGVWLKDTQNRYLIMNQTGAGHGGHTLDDIVGKTDLELWQGELAESHHASDAEVMTTRRRMTMEICLAGPQGDIWMEIDKAPVLDEDGSVLGTVGIARDITERKAVETARETALAEAERLARVRSEFLSQMSHELRTPLNGILGYAQILRRDRTLGERQLAGVNVIQQSGEHLLTLINDILDFAKIEAGKLELSLSDIPLARFLRTIREMIGVRAAQKGLEFICEAAADLPGGIRADEKRLRQVLLNLLANAVKFTDRGEVKLRVSFVPPSQLCFEVEDTGIGIGEDEYEAIFQPFEQAGDPRHRSGGTGLGLAISRQFVRLMGGDIQVRSRIGHGSTFCFELDVLVVPTELAAMHPQRIVTGYEGPRRKVLVVDDVAENRMLAVDMLGRLGFEMGEAMNGRDGLEKAQSLRPDLILMDIVMPEMDGLEATRRLRQLADFHDVPVIAISASVSEDHEQSSLAAGVDAFLPKPIGMDALLTQIATLLKLAWTYEQATAEEPLPEQEAAEPLVVPPAQEIAILHRLALLGNMRDILQQAAGLAELDERYRAFANQLCQLARGYQSKAILSFVERYL